MKSAILLEAGDIQKSREVVSGSFLARRQSSAHFENCQVEELPSRRTAESKNCQIDEPPKSLRIVEPTPLEARKVGAIEGDFVDAMKRFVVRAANCAGQWRSAAFPPPVPLNGLSEQFMAAKSQLCLAKRPPRL
jgi:hypothetical protein